MERIVEIPEGVAVEINGFHVKVSGPLGTLEKDFTKPFIENKIIIEKKDDTVVVKSTNERRKIKAMVGTIAGHLENMFTGVTKGFEYKLKVIYTHFPINLEIKGKEILIKNFAGEKTPRTAKIVGNVEVKINGQEITVKGINREEVGQTAANLEQATKIRGRDIRVFEDGIYIVSKGED